MGDLASQPIDGVIEVEKTAAPDTSKIGSKEFVEKITELLKDKKNVWRSSDTLSQALGVDPIALDKWLRRQHEVISRASKKEGIFLYAIHSRVQPPDQENENVKKAKKTMSRPLVSENDRYATAVLHMTYVNLHECLDKYALLIAERDMEAFSHFTQGKDHLEAGLTLYTRRLNADLRKLPRMT